MEVLLGKGVFFCFREIKESVDSVVWKKEHRLGHSDRHRVTPSLCQSSAVGLWAGKVTSWSPTSSSDSLIERFY